MEPLCLRCNHQGNSWMRHPNSTTQPLRASASAHPREATPRRLLSQSLIPPISLLPPHSREMVSTQACSVLQVAKASGHSQTSPSQPDALAMVGAGGHSCFLAGSPPPAPALPSCSRPPSALQGLLLCLLLVLTLRTGLKVLSSNSHTVDALCPAFANSLRVHESPECPQT